MGELAPAIYFIQLYVYLPICIHVTDVHIALPAWRFTPLYYSYLVKSLYPLLLLFSLTPNCHLLPIYIYLQYKSLYYKLVNNLFTNAFGFL